MKRVLAGLMFSLAPACGATAQTPPPAVGVIVAQKQPVYASQSVVGRIVAPEIVHLQARVTGYLEQQDFTDGQSVRQGELLYVIEQAPYQAAVAQAQAAVDQAKAQAHDAELEYRRAASLLNTAAGQQSAVDLAQATADADAAAVLAAQAQLQTAMINLGYTEIRAPMDGVIGATAVNPGNVVGPNSGVLATIVSEDPMYVSFALPMVDAIHDRAQADALDVRVQLPDGSTYAQTGRVDFIDNQVDPNTDTLGWRATLANPDHALSDGEFVTVTLRAKTPAQQMVLPLGAIIAQQLGDSVLEVGPGNVVTQVPVTLGPEGETDVPVLSGIAPGDRIITEGIQAVHPGMVVEPQPAGAN